MSIVSRRVLAVARIVAALGAVVAIPAQAQDDPPPPPASIVCPGIEEDGLLCASDPLGLDGNCVAFIGKADRLGALYREELAELPDSKQSLLTTSWWGCGPPSLMDVKRLLVSLGSRDALAVLKTEPYRSLPEVPPAPPPSMPTESSCIDLQNPVDRNLCAGRRLAAARAKHQAAFDLCKTRVADALRGDLLSSETAFQNQSRALCEADTADAGEGAKLRAFDRAQCLVQAYDERTRAMLSVHPECAAGD